MKKCLLVSRVYIRDIFEGYYVRSDGDFELNYFIIKDVRKVYCVKVVVIVVREFVISDDEIYGKFQIDDGMGMIWVFGFCDDMCFIRFVKKGDLVQIIGKVVEWCDDKQIFVEGVVRVSFNFWIFYCFEIFKEKVEYVEKVKIVFEIYDRYGIIVKVKVIVKNKGVDEEFFQMIDELYILMFEQRIFEEELFEEEIEEEEEKIEENFEVEKVKEVIMNFLREKGKVLFYKFIVKKLFLEFDEEIIEEVIIQFFVDGEIYELEIGFYELF